MGLRERVELKKIYLRISVVAKLELNPGSKHPSNASCGKRDHSKDQWFETIMCHHGKRKAEGE